MIELLVADDVLMAAADGAAVADMAEWLHLSDGTVRDHLCSVTAETGARTRPEAVRIATEHGRP